MRWKRRRSSLSSCRARWERGELVPVGLEHLQGGGQGREGRAQLVAHVGVEARLALDPLLELVDHGVEREGEAFEVRVRRLNVEPGVEVARGNGARGARHDGQRPQRAGAGEAAERDAEHGGDAPGHEEGEREHAQRVVEVGQVEHVEVVGVDGGDRDPDHDLGRSLRGAVGLRGRRAAQDDLAQLVRNGGGGHGQGGVVGLGAVEEHGVRVRPRVDVGEEHHVPGGAGLQRGAHEVGVGERLVLVRRLPPRQQEVAHGEVGEPTHQDGEDQRPEPEDGRDAGTDAQLHVRAPACSPCPSR